MRILIVNGEDKFSVMLARALTKNRYNADTATDGETGLGMALTGIYDMILLDTNLPRMSGIDLLRRLRERMLNIPVILLSDSGEISDKVTGLDAGADDYMVKPISNEELFARIRALSRRNASLVPDNVITFEDLSLNISTYELVCGENAIRLGAKEMNITELLVRSGRCIISKEDLIVKVWGYDSDAEYNNVEVYISILRKKMKDIHSNVRIRTVRGVGYKLETAVDQPEAED
jgi:DNA-binding response OmpR family regulator